MGDDMTIVPPRARHFSSFVTGPIVRFVDRTLGEVGVNAMLAGAGDLPPRSEIDEVGGWVTYDETKRLLDSAAEVLGGRDALRQACAYIDWDDPGEALEALGSPGEVLRLVSEASAKYSTVTSIEAVEVADDHGIVVAHSVAGYPRFDAMCAVTAGLLAQAAELFGLPAATVVEERCETRGDDSCLFRVSWSTEYSDEARRIVLLEHELTGHRSRIAHLQATVADLVSGAEVEAVLDRIIDRATHAVTAHRYLLAVRTGDRDSEVEVHQIGFDRAEAAGVAESLLADEPDDLSGSPLVVDVESRMRHYGRLAAFNPDGVGFLPEERPLFAAFARLAAAALDSATALESARREAETAHALLELGRGLARVTTVEQTAERLAEAVTSTLDCDMASVGLYDSTEGVLRTGGQHGFPDDVADFLRTVEVRASEVPVLQAMAAVPAPLCIERGNGYPYLDQLMVTTGSRWLVIVPITNGARLYGVVVALSHLDRLHLESRLVERLTGFADQAVTALQNAELLEAVRHQATHDGLTGTANHSLLADRVALALDQARRHGHHVGILFIDVDRFKSINDTFGHPTGDLALQQIASRMCSAVRDVDLVARLGGDEFVVLLPGLLEPDEAKAIAERIHSALEHPFRLDHHEVTISASIGVSVHSEELLTYGELLASADAAMYRAKQSGRDLLSRS